MVRYPVQVPRDNYRGADSRRRKKVQNYNRVASRVEDYLNREVETWKDDTASAIMSYRVALDLGEDDKLVHQIVFKIDCGSTGVTILKGNYEHARNYQPK